ncbi:DUF368 domain-containing protein [Anaerotalea alkaliphila]|uniref:DUF368 domain-containing protein n=1 Tax=Anaerotalea alkaliphila TaxID=2662126 RepID=A0A7X5HY77_9FIRM|nr:DUF368 domain-containing protein [Anaerotalea alkaliphila]NDL68820.1 DUF368 domain-containing protein [Anaerotalea alkaliphila]
MFRSTNFIKKLLKGGLIGLANIIPGVSGGTMAVSMGIYDELIYAATHLRKDFKRNAMTLLPYLLGALAGIGALSFLVRFALERFPLPTAALFIGLILGGLPVLAGKVRGARFGALHALLFLAFFLLVVLMASTGERETEVFRILLGPVSMAKLFLVGMVAAGTMIVPGVSGSLVMMLLGYYNLVIANISLFLEAVFSWDLPEILYGVGFFAPLGLGMVFGIILVAKLIDWLFRKAPLLAYASIFGLVAASPIAILLGIDLPALSPGTVAASLLALLSGAGVALALGRE